MNRTHTVENEPASELPPTHPPIVSRADWEAARARMLIKEKAHMRAGDALAAERRLMPWMEVEKGYNFEGPRGKASLLDLFERPAAADRISRLLRARRAWLAGACLHRLLVGCGPGLASLASECPRHDPGLRVPRTAVRHRAAEGPDGLDYAVVHDHGQFRRRFRRG